MKKTIRSENLYLVTSEDASNDMTTLEITKQAIQGGIDIIQIREKKKSYDELIVLGNEILKICNENDTILVINDDPDLAKKLNAHGVHLGQEDMKKYPIQAARKIVGEQMIIGISTHSVDQVIEANSLDVDYIAYGPVFKTKTKDYFIGIDDVEKVLNLSRHPVFCIGGIDLDNIDFLIEKGVKNIAVIRGITQAKNIQLKVMAFKDRINRTKEVFDYQKNRE